MKKDKLKIELSDSYVFIQEFYVQGNKQIRNELNRCG
jgi:hypothetical protein